MPEGGPPRFTPDRAAEVRALLDGYEEADSEEKRRRRRHLRRRGLRLSQFPDIAEWSARAFDELVKEGRVVIGEQSEGAP